MAKTVAAVIKLIDQFTSPSKQVQTASKNIEKRFKEMGDKVAAIGDVFTNAGETMMKAVSLPLAAAGTAAIKFADESQNAFNQYAAATGTAADEMGRYEKIINDIYKQNFGESMGDVANSLAIVKQNMQGIDDNSLSGVTKYALTLSDTLGIDVAESSRAANTLIKNFGVTAEEAFNLMTQGAQNGLDFSGEMIDSINEYSVQFEKAGMDAEDMFNIMAAGAESGAFNLDKVGDAVKEFSIRAIDGSDSTAEGFKAIGLDATQMAAKFAKGGDAAKEVFDKTIKGLAAMEDPVAQNIAGVNLFGTMWEDLGSDAVLAMANTTGAIDMTKDSMMDMVNAKYGSLSDALGGLWRTIQVDVLQPIGDMLIPYVSKAVDAVSELTDWWNALEPATQKNIVKFAGIAAAIAPVLLGIGKLHHGIGGAITTFGKLRGSINNAGGVLKMLKSPANIATVAVVGIATAAILIYKNWDKIKPLLDKVGAAIVSFAKGAQKWFGDVKQKALDLWDGIKTAFDNVVNKINSAIDSAITTLKGIVDFISQSFKSGVQAALDVVGGYFSTWYEGISDVIENVKGILGGIVDFISGVFTGNWEKAWNGLKDIVGNAFGALEGLVKTPINAVIGLVNKAIDGINKISVDLPDIVGGGHIGFDIPHIPALAKGTDNWRGGVVQVHERGGEIIDLPQGTRVYPHDESVRMARAESKKNIAITIAKLADQIIVREDADIDRIAEALARKLEQTAYNMA